MRIGIDIDGVLRDLHQPLLDAWYRLTGIHKTKADITKWEIHECLECEKAGYPAAEFYEWWLTNRALMRFAPVIPDCVTALTVLTKRHELYIVSAPVYPVGRHTTLDWIEDNLPDVWNGIFFGEDKGILQVDALIDDYWVNLDASQAQTKLLFWQPWNASQTQYRHVHSWMEILNLLGD